MSGSASFIRANLQHFGIQDMNVVAYFPRYLREYNWDGGSEARDDPERTTSAQRLSEICAGYQWKRGHLHAEIFGAGMNIQTSSPIGYINSDREFLFLASPDLRTCLGWAIATDGGSRRILSHVDLDVEVRRLSAALVKMPERYLRPRFFPRRAEIKLGNYFFEGGWAKALEATFRDGDTSRFSEGEGGLPFKKTLWRVGTRTLLGQEHPGFRFGY